MNWPAVGGVRAGPAAKSNSVDCLGSSHHSIYVLMGGRGLLLLCCQTSFPSLSRKRKDNHSFSFSSYWGQYFLICSVKDDTFSILARTTTGPPAMTESPTMAKVTFGGSSSPCDRAICEADIQKAMIAPTMEIFLKLFLNNLFSY